jgi:peptidoglycan/LPS O-acetylase OafA/YrhL
VDRAWPPGVRFQVHNRLVQLDLLRFLAIVLVLGRHMSPCPSDVNVWLGGLTTIWQRGGWIGVDLFFVLSGFLVSGLLFREYKSHASVNIGRFLIRRAFKIYPGFWLLIAVTVVPQIAVEVPVPMRKLMGEGLLIQNYMGGLWNHTWSLAVEAHFYLLLAVLTACLLRSRRSDRDDPFAPIPLTVLAVAFICIGLRTTNAVLPFSTFTHLFATHIRVDGLFFGVLLSYGWHFKGLATNTWLARRSACLFAVGVILLSPAFLFELEHTTWIPVAGLTVFYLGSGALLLAMLYMRVPDSSVVRCLATVGTFSYSIYLWHMPVQLWLIPIIEAIIGVPLHWYAYAAVYLVGALLLGIEAGRLIEYPVLRVRDRLYPADAARGSLTTKEPKDVLAAAAA